MMILPTSQYILFCITVFLLAATPGPNWAYLVSRSLTQGSRAGMLSLAGTLSAFLFYMLFTAFGLSMIFYTVPKLYLLLKIAGGCYLLWLAWKELQPGRNFRIKGNTSPLEDSDARLYRMGLVTNLLNPKTAIFYLAIFPAFIQADAANVSGQILLLGFTQIGISFLVNSVVIILSVKLISLVALNRYWSGFRKWFMGGVLAFLGLKVLMDTGR